VSSAAVLAHAASDSRLPRSATARRCGFSRDAYDASSRNTPIFLNLS
jgi:hypothetical protein